MESMYRLYVKNNNLYDTGWDDISKISIFDCLITHLILRNKITRHVRCINGTLVESPTRIFIPVDIILIIMRYTNYYYKRICGKITNNDKKKHTVYENFHHLF